MSRQDPTFKGKFILHRETEKALLVSEDGEKDNAEWVPLSQCESIDRSATTNEVTLVMTEWIAKP